MSSDLSKLRSLWNHFLHRGEIIEIEEHCGNFSRHYDVFGKLDSLAYNWRDQLPDLREIFRPDEIERLLTNFVYSQQGGRDRRPFVEFVIRTGYKNKPEVDDAGGKPAPLQLLRTTPLHHAHRRANSYLVRQFFKIYDRFHVNYIDEHGFTHFHAACAHDCHDVVKKFLELGRIDPNLLVTKTGDSPLHLALARDAVGTAVLLLEKGADPNLANDEGQTPLHVICKRFPRDDLAEVFFGCNDAARRQVRVNARDRLDGNAPLHLALDRDNRELAELLLRRGADPTLANDEGLTALHVIARNGYDDGSAKLFFEICAELKRTVQIDARDEKGRTPLQWAVANLMPNTVKVLLDRGADLANFRFPTQDYFAERLESHYRNYLGPIKVRLAAGALDSLERLEKRGYKSKPSDILTIMEFFAARGLIKPPTSLDKLPYSDLFQNEAKKITVNPSVSLYDLIQSRPKEAKKLVTYAEYIDYDELSYQKFDLWHNHRKLIEHITMHLCEQLSREFFRSWAVHYFMELTHYRLSIECCKKIINDSFKNCDLYNICLAATSQNS